MKSKKSVNKIQNHFKSQKEHSIQKPIIKEHNKQSLEKEHVEEGESEDAGSIPIFGSIIAKCYHRVPLLQLFSSQRGRKKDSGRAPERGGTGDREKEQRRTGQERTGQGRTG